MKLTSKYLMVVFQSVPYNGMPSNVSAASRAPHSLLHVARKEKFHNILSNDLLSLF